MSDLAAELRALKKAGVALDGDFERASTVAAARSEVIKRAQAWEAELQALVEQLGDETAALFEDATPIRPAERIGGFLPGSSGLTYDPFAPRGSGLNISSTHTDLAMPGGHWAMAWQCHRTRLSRLTDLLQQLGRVRARKKTRPKDGPTPENMSKHIAKARSLYGNGETMTLTGAARQVVNSRLGRGACQSKTAAIQYVRKRILTLPVGSG